MTHHNLTRTIICVGMAIICHWPGHAQSISRDRLGEVLAGCGSMRTLSRHRSILMRWGVEDKLPLASPIWEEYRISSHYGMRFHPIRRRWQMHPGYDLSCPLATRIHATGDGVVSFCGWHGGYGYCIIIRHLYGFETLYGHLSRTHAFAGKRVRRGDVIGFVGNTGLSTGYHLHYEIRKNGNPIEPTIP